MPTVPNAAPEFDGFDLRTADKPVAAAPAFDLEAADREIARDDDLRAKLRRTFAENPDEFARAYDLSKATGFSIDLVKRNKPDVENYVEAQRVDPLKFRLENPDFAAWIDGPQGDDNLAVSKDDVGNLSGIAWAMKAGPQAFGAGVDQVELGKLRYKQMREGLTPDEMARADALSGTLNRGRRYAADGFFSESLVETAKMLPAMGQSLLGGAKGAVVGGAAGAATGAAAGAATGATAVGVPTGGLGAIPGAGAGAAGGAVVGGAAGARAGATIGAGLASLEMEAGLAFDEFRDFRDSVGRPLDEGTAQAAAMTAGMINAGLEVTGLSAVLKTVPGVERVMSKGATGAVRQALKSPTVLAAFKQAGAKFGKGWTTEVATEVGQELVLVVAGELAKQASGQDIDPASMSAIAERMAQTLEQAAKGSWILPASGAGAGFIVDARRANKAKATVERMQAFGDSAKASKLRERLPAKFREYVESVKKANDGAQTVFVDAAKAGELFQSAGLDATEVFREVMGEDGGREYSEALALGGKVAIPVEVYAEKLAGTDWHGALQEHATFDEDGMTPFEAAEFEKSRDAELAKIYEGQGRPADDPANPIFDDTVGQLIAAGFSRKDAEDQAQIRVGVFRGLAGRAGMSAEEFLSRFPLEVGRPLDPVFAEKRKTNSLDPLIDAVRSGKLPTDDELFGPRLISTIVQMGGINPESMGGSDLLAVLDQTKRPGLVSSKGKNVEDMAETLAASGWRELFEDLDDYGRPGPNELIERIRDDLFGEVRAPTARNEERLAFRRAAEDLGGELMRLGLDVQALTNEQIVQRLAEEDAKTAAGRAELDQAAYHGTPHSFDRFSLDKIGTGEGAQAFGWGLYFAENPGVAEGYREALAGDDNDYYLDGQIVPWEQFRNRPLLDKLAMQAVSRGDAYANVVQNWRDGGVSEERVAVLEAKIAEYAGRVEYKPTKKGSLYTVEIPDEVTARFLDWDAPLSKQPASVRDALAKAYPDFFDSASDDYDAAETGQMIYQRVAALNARPEKTGWTEISMDTEDRAWSGEKAASKALNKAGIPGIKYLDAGSRDTADGTRNLVVFDDSLVTITHKDGSPVTAAEKTEFLEQRRKKEPRGSITGALPRDRQKSGKRPFKISLFKKADLTTFVHETGHMAFAMLADLAADFSQIPPDQRTTGQQAIVDDFEKFLAWTGATSFETMTVPQLEMTARALEAYVMEGKAPSLELRSVFSRFRSFMVAVYKTLRGLNVELTDEVRGVFDRLLASDEQIKQTKEAERYDALWNAPDQLLAIGANGDEITAYLKATQAAQDRAVDKLTNKVMAPIRRRREESFKDLRATVEREVAAELDETPVYRAIAALTGQNVPPDLVGMIRKLDREWLLDRYGQEWINKNLLRRRVYAAEGGMSPDVAASLLGYGSGRELVEAIAEAPNRRDYLKAETERRLNEIIPDPLRDGSISDEAIAALHNERRGDVLALELRILNRQAGGTSDLPKQVARRIAERLIGDRSVRNISPVRYKQDERRAARKAVEALIAKDYEAAAAAKRQELLAFYLWKVSTEAREEADKARDYLDAQTKTAARERLAKAGAEYVEATDDILSGYGFRPRGDRPSGLRDWVARQDELGNETAVPEEVIRRTERPPVSYRDVSMSELRAVRDAVRNVAHLAKLSREALSNDQVVEWEAAQADMAARVRASLDGKKKPFTEAEASTWEAAREFAKGWMDGILRPETIIEWLDGGQQGPWHDLFWNQAQAAHDRRDALRERVMKPLVDMVDTWDSKRRASMAEKIPIPSLGEALTRSTLVSMALNMGNASNLDKLQRGGIWRDGQHVPFTDTTTAEIREALSAEDWQMVQFMWDQVDSMWPDVVEFQKSMGGLVPEKVEAQAVSTPHGSFRGGYWPVVYDPRQSAVGAKQEASKSIKDAMSGITRASTKKGFLKERTQVARPLLLDFQRILSRHVDEVITDLTHRRFVLQANKVLADSELSSLVRSRIGDAAFDSLKGMVGNTIADRRYYDPALDAQDRLFDRLVSNTAVAALGFKIATAIGNLVVAPMQAAARVSPRFMVRSMAQFIAAPRATRDLVWSMSPMMRYRAENLDASFSEVMKSLRGKNDLRAQVARASMAVHRWADFMGSTGIWLGRYQQAVDAGETQDAAVRLADKAIRQTQTAGAPKDLSAFERSPQAKLFKLFLGPMLIMNNRIRDAVQMRGAVQNWPEALGTLLAVWFIPAFMFELAVGRGPDDEDDDGEVSPAEAAKWAAIKIAMFPLLTLPYLRDGAASVEAFLGGDPMPARSHPVGEAVNLLAGAGRQVKAAFVEDDVDEGKLAKSLIKAAGPIVGLPTGQLTLTGDFIFDVLTGEFDPDSVTDAQYLIYRRDPRDNP
ncbi:MAG TPA: hypothetical protein VFZ38_10745 [Vicinamibacterales bacterium]